jgi:hypothetical protein
MNISCGCYVEGDKAGVNLVLFLLRHPVMPLLARQLKNKSTKRLVSAMDARRFLYWGNSGKKNNAKARHRPFVLYNNGASLLSQVYLSLVTDSTQRGQLYLCTVR